MALWVQGLQGVVTRVRRVAARKGRAAAADPRRKAPPMAAATACPGPENSTRGTRGRGGLPASVAAVAPRTIPKMVRRAHTPKESSSPGWPNRGRATKRQPRPPTAVTDNQPAGRRRTARAMETTWPIEVPYTRPPSDDGNEERRPVSPPGTHRTAGGLQEAEQLFRGLHEKHLQGRHLHPHAKAAPSRDALPL